MGHTCSMYGGGAHKVMVGRPGGNKPTGRTWHRWEDNKMDLQEMAWEGMNWTDRAQDM